MKSASRKQKNFDRVASMVEFDKQFYLQGFANVAGVDEVGRGPIAGPVFCAAVILPNNAFVEGLDDSKKLTKKARELLYDVIIDTAVAYSVCSVGAPEIDVVNIRRATLACMEQCVANLSAPADIVLTDGVDAINTEFTYSKCLKEHFAETVPENCDEFDWRKNYKDSVDAKFTGRAITNGDQKSLCIAAASIIAKVCRDRHMEAIVKMYPNFEFGKHKGYETAEHREAILQHGLCDIHRKTFTKKYSQ